MLNDQEKAAEYLGRAGREYPGCTNSSGWRRGQEERQRILDENERRLEAATGSPDSTVGTQLGEGLGALLSLPTFFLPKKYHSVYYVTLAAGALGLLTYASIMSSKPARPVVNSFDAAKQEFSYPAMTNEAKHAFLIRNVVGATYLDSQNNKKSITLKKGTELNLVWDKLTAGAYDQNKKMVFVKKLFGMAKESDDILAEVPSVRDASGHPIKLRLRFDAMRAVYGSKAGEDPAADKFVLTSDLPYQKDFFPYIFVDNQRVKWDHNRHNIFKGVMFPKGTVFEVVRLRKAGSTDSYRNAVARSNDVVHQRTGRSRADLDMGVPVRVINGPESLAGYFTRIPARQLALYGTPDKPVGKQNNIKVFLKNDNAK